MLAPTPAVVDEDARLIAIAAVLIAVIVKTGILVGGD